MANVSGNAIYSPPKEGLPHLVVAIKDGEVTGFTPVRSRDEARAVVAAQRVTGENSGPSPALP